MELPATCFSLLAAPLLELFIVLDVLFSLPAGAPGLSSHGFSVLLLCCLLVVSEVPKKGAGREEGVCSWHSCGLWVETATCSEVCK